VRPRPRLRSRLRLEHVDPEIERAVREAGRVLRGLGAQVDTIAVPEAAEAMGEQRRVQMIAAEALAVMLSGEGPGS
jgi:hypothetical protein